SWKGLRRKSSRPCPSCPERLQRPWLSDGSRGDGSVAGGGELGQERIPHQRRHVAATEVSGESFVRNVHLGQPGHVSAHIPTGVGRGSSRCSRQPVDVPPGQFPASRRFGTPAVGGGSDPALLEVGDLCPEVPALLIGQSRPP